MKKLLVGLVFMVMFGIGVSSVQAGYVSGYYRSNGTYVQPHYRSNPDRSVYNNWSYQGNVNPYTGSVGTRTYDSYRPSYRSYNSYYRGY